MIWLLDGNALVALAIETHVFHERVRRWFDALDDPFATCAITEGTLLRIHMKLAADPSAGAAWLVLKEIYAMPDHRFWEDGFSYREISHAGLTGSAQVTDAWLAELARRRSAKLATLDVAFANSHADACFLIPD